MDFEFTAEEKKFQEEVRNFFQTEEATKEAKREYETGLGFGPATSELLRKLGERGWLTPTWPKKYGGLGLPDIYRYIVMEEIDRWVGTLTLVGSEMAGPTILKYGSEKQKEEYLPRIARGEIKLALGYTEPHAGSDLASLEIKAEDKGDHFLLNGQKMFNTACHFAQYHWLGARTADVKPKHRGISLFIVDLRTQGITIEPIWIFGGKRGAEPFMTYPDNVRMPERGLGSRTNVVYYEDVKVPKECLVGEKNRGFYYIMEALDYERIYPLSGLERYLNEIVEVARETGKGKDPFMRRRLAELRTRLEIGKFFALRIPVAIDRGRTPNYEASELKVIFSELGRDIADVAFQVLGPYAQLKEESKRAPLNGEFEWFFREFPRNFMTRGTCEIMRNVIATRGLGLPR